MASIEQKIKSITNKKNSKSNSAHRNRRRRQDRSRRGMKPNTTPTIKSLNSSLSGFYRLSHFFFHQKKKDMKNLKTWECSLRKSSVYICIFLPPKWPSFGGWFWNVAHLYLVLTIYRLNFLSSITKSPSFDDIDNKTKEIPAV